MLTVVKAGPLTTVQDLGRPGWAHLGVPRSGALDEPALRTGNRLVGNDVSAAALEITLGGFTAVVSRPAVVALTGALAPLRVDGVEVPYGRSTRAESRVEVGRASTGVRCYLAIDGGIDVPPVLGSRSTDTLSWLGPPRVVNGMALPLGDPSGQSTVDDLAPPQRPGVLWLRIRLGPRTSWFAADAMHTLFDAYYRVRPESNRIGVRLAGPPLPRAFLSRELPSEGVVLGAVQVPADGRPLVFLADHPTTGGYPVIGVVVRDDLPLLAQARPGDTVRFRGLEQ